MVPFEEILLRIETSAVGAMAETVSDNFANRVQKPLHLPDDAPELLTAIDALLIKKRGAPEMGLAPQAPILNRSIEAGLRRLESAHIEHIVRPNVIDRLNALLHETVHRR